MARRERRLTNVVRKFDAGDCDSSVRERFEPGHRRTASLDRAVVLLDDVVQVSAGPHVGVSPIRMLASQEPERAARRGRRASLCLAPAERSSRELCEKRAPVRLRCHGPGAAGSPLSCHACRPLARSAPTADRIRGRITCPSKDRRCRAYPL